MKVRLTDALHARPASLLVRLASQLAADVVISRGACRANAKDVLDVLALGALCGEEIEVVATGDGAAEAEAAIAKLVERGFDADLVPETGAGAVEGIAIGRAVVLARADERAHAREGVSESERVRAAVHDAEREVAALVRALPEAEAKLFAPEVDVLRALGPRLCARVDAGLSAEEAVRAETSGDAAGATDLVLDAGARLGAALAGRGGDAHRVDDAIARIGDDDDVVLVVEELAPSVVAALPPRVVGIVAGDAVIGQASHAAILARGRGLPLALVAEHVVASIVEGDRVVVDTTIAPARVWVAPGDALVAEARARAAIAAREDDAPAALDHLGVAVRANVGSLYERVPAGADGIGLLRTELLFADRTTCPTEHDQAATIAAVARRAGGRIVTVRLFDAGGDKPLAWLPATTPDARGVALLFEHEGTLATQLAAIARAKREGADVRVLLPLTRSAGDLDAVRARVGDVAVGAMIETPEAVEHAAAIAAAADFVCVGTNDLAALAFGADRAHARVALDAPLLRLVARVVAAAHAAGKTVTVCGEIAADEDAAEALVGVGVDALSVAPSRVARVRRHLAAASRERCAAAAQTLLSRA